MVLRSRVVAPDWTAGGDKDKQAKCLWFPLPTHNDVNADTDPWFYDYEQAQAVDLGTYDGKVCPMLSQCLHISLVNNDQVGVWGGMYPIQRKWIRKNIPRDRWPDLGRSLGYSSLNGGPWEVPSVEWLEEVAEASGEEDQTEF